MTQEQAVQKFKYFVTENSTILALLEEPLGNDQDPQPTVTRKLFRFVSASKELQISISLNV